MKTYTTQEVAATIDHAVLKPAFTSADIIRNARICIQRQVKSMCVRPTDVALAAEQLKGSGVIVSAVVGFPHGANRPETKALESRLAIQDGARELDMVMNIGRFLSGDYALIQADIAGVVAEAKPSGVLVKVILETCYLNPDQIIKACLIARDAGADFVKTSTGFGDGSATPEAVALMVRTVAPALGVKASGGIKTWAMAVAYLEQGCTRLGIGATEAVLDGAEGKDNY